MIDLTEWSTLRHAYGPAGGLPAVPEKLSPDPDDTVMTEVWSLLFHQGTVYSASYAALPVLETKARSWRPSDRALILALAAAIVASDDRGSDVGADPLGGREATLASLTALTRR